MDVVVHKEYLHGHLFCGLGGGAKGFKRSRARVGKFEARYRCVGGIDVDPAAIVDFEKAAGVKGTVLDLFSLEQYRAFWGKAPPADWRERGPDDIRRAFNYERPHTLFLSAPCKGFSGLLAESLSKSAKYQALNGLTLRGIWLALEAFKDDPVDVILFENVPRIAKRGRHLLDQIVALLRSYGYAVAETTHDCGELGGLGQSRKRFLLIARHVAKVPPFIYEPPQRPLRGVGEIIGRLPVPGPDMVLPMHRMPALQWKTWVRLAFVEAGADWRSLNRLNVKDGFLADYGIAPDVTWNEDVLGVREWSEPSGTITSRSGPTNGRFAVADPRAPEDADRGAYGVGGWDDPAATLTSQRSPGQGRFSVADPRIDGHVKSVQMGVGSWEQPAATIKGDVSVGTGRYAVADPRISGRPLFNSTFRIVPFNRPSPAIAGPGGAGGGVAVADPRYPNWHPGASSAKMRVTDWRQHGGTVTGSQQVGSGALAVADPRPGERADYKQTKYRVTKYGEAAGTVISASTTGNGAFCVADPRPDCLKQDGDAYKTAGHYGIVPWERHANAIPAFAKNNNGFNSVADPRPAEVGPGNALPRPADKLVCCIRALDNTWHRPFTTLELAALQSLVDAEDDWILDLCGQSDSAWRERIGNAVPPDAAEAIGSTILRTLLAAHMGQTFQLSAEPIWVQPIVVGLSVDQAATAGAAD
jgi:site-specific DNA-cytosine methylase